MSTPNKATVNAAALAAQLALKNAANAAFIADADIVIAEVEAQGKFKVKLPVLKPASMKDIATYYQALGYGAFYDQCSEWNEPMWPGPWSYPFGYFSSFYPYWHICNCKQQCYITISWR